MKSPSSISTSTPKTVLPFICTTPDEKNKKPRVEDDDGATSKNVVFLSWSDGKIVGIARVYIYIYIYTYIYIYIFECM